MVYWFLSLLAVLVCTCVSPCSPSLQTSALRVKVLGTHHQPAGHNLLFQCVYANGSAIPLGVDVSWEKDETSFPSDSDRVRIVQRAQAHQALVILDSIVTDSGRYRCIAGGQKSPEVEIAVVVIPEPEVSLPKTNFTCLSGESLHIGLILQNVAAFRLTDGGEDISRKRYHYFLGNSTLVIYSLQPSDTGEWTIHAGNAVGSQTVNFSVNVNIADDLTSYSSGNSNVGLIVGITVGSLVLLLLSLLSFALVLRWRWSRRSVGNYKLEGDSIVDSMTLDNNAD